MRILFFILLMSIIGSPPGMAQNINSFVGFYGGLSIPVGQYKAKNLVTGCFTLPGFNTGIEGSWYFTHFLGIGGQLDLSMHPVDVGALGYEKVINDPFLTDVTTRSEAYQIITAAPGIFTRWDILNNLSFHGKLLGGVMWAKTPYQLFKPTYFSTGPDYFEITSSKDRNLALITGAGIQLDVSPCIALRAEGEFLYSKMIFGFITATGKRLEYRTISIVNVNFILVILL